MQAAEELGQRKPVERLEAMESGLDLRCVCKSRLVHYFLDLLVQGRGPAGAPRGGCGQRLVVLE